MLNIPTFTRAPVLEADLVATALRPDQVAPRRIGLVICAADWPPLALVTLTALGRTLGDLQPEKK